jgi:sugar/nucleoside kinase (ribokinase family)
MTGVASFGGTAGYIGKVADDDLGARFTQANSARRASPSTPRRAPAPPGTARSLDRRDAEDGQRSMNTYLGAADLVEHPLHHRLQPARADVLDRRN